MKPFPPELQSLRPVPADVLPERPWWRVGWFSNDPPSTPGVASDCMYRRPSRYRRSDGKHAGTLEEVAAIDASEPLSFPGIRAGQVWHDPAVDGEVAILGRVGDLWVCHGQEVSTKVLANLLISCFLLADPMCPHLAPWAPVEVK